MPGVSICKEDITITNIYAFNKGVQKCIKQKLTEMKGEIKKSKNNSSRLQYPTFNNW